MDGHHEPPVLQVSQSVKVANGGLLIDVDRNIV
jgi:hypothetical protein